VQVEGVEVLDRPLGGYGWGGARPGAGAKPKQYEKSEDLKDLDKAKARHESVKADLAELELRQRRGELVERDGVRKASAMALQTLAQGLRSIPDALERELNLSPEIADRIGVMIDSALNDCAESFEMMTGPVIGDDVTDVR
jgi:phage terminase Nu1 subunit (DNA packaging protein)